MNTLSILALYEIPNVGQRAVEKVLSLSLSSEPQNPSDLIDMLKKANDAFGRISIPNNDDAEVGWNKAQEIWQLSQQNGIQIISRESPSYPKYLLQIPDPPVLLHVKGNIDALNKDCIAIIGTREPTNYGFNAGRKLGEIFAKEGYVIVSGLAEGIDTAAHLGALDADGITVAVLAHGLDTIFPSKNKELSDIILRNNGTLISEYSWGTNINKGYFISRDRIQSGLSLGVFVVETDISGGAMHTAKFCKDQKRALIVLQHPENLRGHLKTFGNENLISNGEADIIFEDDNDVDVVKIKMNQIKNGLLNSQKDKKDVQKSKLQMTLD